MSEVKNREVVYWSCDPHCEQLSADSIHEAVEVHIDDCAWVPPTLTVHGFARMVPTDVDVLPLEDVLERLDETYGDPEGDSTDSTQRMRDAEDEFARIVLEEYESWACEEVCEEQIDVRQWLKENRPDWEGEVEIREPAAPGRGEE